MVEACQLDLELLMSAPRGVVILWTTRSQFGGELLGDEQKLAISVSSQRHKQLVTGRRLAREAIGRIGGDTGTVLPADHNGVPIWPANIKGSISHTASLCAVAVAGSGTVSYLGIDIETNRANFEENEWHLVSNDEEISMAGQCTDLTTHQFVNLVFSAKEAAYKSLYPALHGRQIGFLDLHCQLRSDCRGFDVEVLIDDQGLPRDLSVDWVTVEDHILTLAWVNFGEKRRV